MKAKDLNLTDEFKAKVQALANLIRVETFERLKADCLRHVGHISDSHLVCFAQNSEVKVHYGKSYVRVDLDSSGKYMIDFDGNIFGIKGYGVIHRGHQFGTLDTINQFNWGYSKALRTSA